MLNHHNKAALLVMDMQNGIVSRFATSHRSRKPTNRLLRSFELARSRAAASKSSSDLTKLIRKF